MFKFLGIIVGLFAIYFLVSGAIVAYAKVNPESSDILLMGIALMFVSQIFTGIHNHGNSSNKESALPKS
jgi:cell division protein FtsW (lipid II flippase)